MRPDVNDALTVIEAIKKISCRNELPNEDIYHLMQQAEHECKAAPEIDPPSELWVALSHLEKVLNRPVENDALRNSQYR